MHTHLGKLLKLLCSFCQSFSNACNRTPDFCGGVHFYRSMQDLVMLFRGSSTVSAFVKVQNHWIFLTRCQDIFLLCLWQKKTPKKPGYLWPDVRGLSDLFLGDKMFLFLFIYLFHLWYVTTPLVVFVATKPYFCQDVREFFQPCLCRRKMNNNK